MILVDTSVWIPYFRADPDIFPFLHRALEARSVLGLECIFGELLQGARDRRECQMLTQYWENLEKMEEKGLWIEAGVLASQQNFPSKGIGLIDATILVAARRRRAQIWTLDKKLLSVLEKHEIY